MQHHYMTTPVCDQPIPAWSPFPPPWRYETHTHARTPPGMDWAGQASDVLIAPAIQGWSQLWGSLLDPWMQALRLAWAPVAQWPVPAPAPAHAVGCACHRCRPDDCHCRCCVADADLLVYAHAGERRMVPLVIDNNMRRARAVELDLSDWTTRAGQPVQVSGQLAPPAAFTLQPCEERTVMLAIDVVEHKSDTQGEAAAIDTRLTRAPQLDECRVFYADLRVKGCDIRPVRIAVAVLPGDCAAYRIDCRCVCC